MTDKPLFTGEDLIFAYTRAEALADGVLKDLTELAKSMAFKLPTAITAAAWSAAIEPPPNCPELSTEERAWDVLNGLRFAILRNGTEKRADFAIAVRSSQKTFDAVQLKALIHPGDASEPVITIMLPHED